MKINQIDQINQKQMKFFLKQNLSNKKKLQINHKKHNKIKMYFQSKILYMGIHPQHKIIMKITIRVLIKIIKILFLYKNQ